ncbi:fructose-1,6-bisphosphatase [Methanofollis formosanus]|uniref:Fructose-1,6-bisphosphatase class 1 n=1 Tax=Methanofollis formosanus TaxID=299308 RepID=A0A8G1A0F1_9EURY|nr:class 1 fructose-bisphosphatase [Methanofollis formosanus]QYZ78265.1 fructose-1,6-bisphosphatase [Methanofollis formosanus]
MTTLREYLESAGCEAALQDLIMLIGRQAAPIREAFITHQAYVDTENVFGEQQAAMDTWADAWITRVLGESGLIRELASEEQEEVSVFPDSTHEYAVVMDPMDGSSLIQTNLSVGTIIGIFGGGTVMQSGRNLKAALYMLYGPMTTLTLSVGQGVQVFAMDKDGEYRLLHQDMKIPEGKNYGTGGTRPTWVAPHRAFIEAIEEEGAKIRYTGSFVADFHQILTYGGIYCYPALNEKPKGKLRLLYEAIPVGFIAEQAGGRTSDGHQSLLDIVPEEPHQRTPIYVGSPGMIRKVEAAFEGTGK